MFSLSSDSDDFSAMRRRGYKARKGPAAPRQRAAVAASAMAIRPIQAPQQKVPEKKKKKKRKGDLWGESSSDDDYEGGPGDSGSGGEEQKSGGIPTGTVTSPSTGPGTGSSIGSSTGSSTGKQTSAVATTGSGSGRPPHKSGFTVVELPVSGTKSGASPGSDIKPTNLQPAFDAVATSTAVNPAKSTQDAANAAITALEEAAARASGAGGSGSGRPPHGKPGTVLRPPTAQALASPVALPPLPGTQTKPTVIQPLTAQDLAMASPLPQQPPGTPQTAIRLPRSGTGPGSKRVELTEEDKKQYLASVTDSEAQATAWVKQHGNIDTVEKAAQFRQHLQKAAADRVQGVASQDIRTMLASPYFMTLNAVERHLKEMIEAQEEQEAQKLREKVAADATAAASSSGSSTDNPMTNAIYAKVHAAAGDVLMKADARYIEHNYLALEQQFINQWKNLFENAYGKKSGLPAEVGKTYYDAYNTLSMQAWGSEMMRRGVDFNKVKIILDPTSRSIPFAVQTGYEGNRAHMSDAQRLNQERADRLMGINIRDNKIAATTEALGGAHSDSQYSQDSQQDSSDSDAGGAPMPRNSTSKGRTSKGKTSKGRGRAATSAASAAASEPEDDDDRRDPTHPDYESRDENDEGIDESAIQVQANEGMNFIESIGEEVDISVLGGMSRGTGRVDPVTGRKDEYVLDIEERVAVLERLRALKKKEWEKEGGRDFTRINSISLKADGSFTLGRGKAVFRGTGGIDERIRRQIKELKKMRHKSKK